MNKITTNGVKMKNITIPKLMFESININWTYFWDVLL